MIDPFAIKLAATARLASEDARVLQALAAGPIRRYEPRADIVLEGDDARCVRIIVSGWACRYKQLPDGRRQIVALLLPGDVCDHDTSLPDGMDHALGALDAVVLREVDPGAFAEMSSADGPIGLMLRQAMSAEVAIQREWTRNLGRRDARERLAHLFCELWHRLRAAGMVDSDGYDLPLSQPDLADALGLTAVHVNRVLRVLRSERLIVLTHRRLTIPSLDALEAVALFDGAYLHLRARPGAGRG